ncbi:response regulator [Archangium primigenium]|uniref:response regulator n=1 Tax=[Archangium] primigenium TaxID=2792470 RepID=UPI00195E6E24|nr:response regulator [Archangium primigenium]MBM7116010.1 response regulator [Archangium primigenium]
MSIILLVDDEPDDLALFADVLELMEHRVVRARDGQEALELARARRPDLVVTDCHMPRMTGGELSQWLSREPRLRDVPVLMHSSAADPHAPGVRCFLPKDADLPVFERAVDELLGGLRAARRTSPSPRVLPAPPACAGVP